MTTLSRGDLATDLWMTENYVLQPGKDDFGYEIVNRSTGCTEMIGEQEPQCIMAMMWLDKEYSNVMKDPEREFKSRQNQTAAQESSRIVGPRTVQ